MSKAAQGRASYGLRIQWGEFVLVRREYGCETILYNGPDMGAALQFASSDNQGPLFIPLLAAPL